MKIYNVAVALVSSPRRTVALFMFINVLLAFIVLGSFMSFALAQGGEAAQTASIGLKYLGAGLSTAGSTIGAGVALYGATSAGAAALVERPELAAWVLINAGLGEGVAIYGLIISILILAA